MKEKIQMFAAKLASQRHLMAVRDGLAASMPLIIVGSMFMLVANFPLGGLTEWLDSVGIRVFLNKVSNSTFGLVGLTATFSIAYNLARHYKLDALSAGLISLGSWVFLTPMDLGEGISGLSSTYLGTAGMFVGILVALISTEIYRVLVEKDVQIKMPDAVPPNVSRAFAALLPAGVVLTIWMVLSFLLSLVGITNVHQLLQDTIGKPLSLLSSTLPGILVIIFVQCFFWMFGIHGANITGGIVEPLLLQNSDANRMAFQAGTELPHIITTEFLYNFVFSGGAGCVIALTLLTFLFSKSEQNKALGKLSIAPVSFQIAEPMLFGFPTILNVKMTIPFFVAPLVTAIITYYAMYFGIVPKPSGVVIPWTTPPVLAGFLASGGHISGAILQIVTIIINMAIYYPFFLADDKEKLEMEQEAGNNAEQAEV